MTNLKRIELSVILGLVFSIVLSFASFDAKCDDMRENVLRLHIIANSDSKADQDVKLKVRDAVLNHTSSDFSKCDTLDDAIITARTDKETINNIAKKVLKENGFEYGAKTSVKKEYFSIRDYENFSLPAGEYNSLTVRLGNANGHNWWCVVFPGVCIPAADNIATLNKTVDESSCAVAYNPQKYVLRFKTAELYEKIKYNFKNLKK